MRQFEYFDVGQYLNEFDRGLGCWKGGDVGFMGGRSCVEVFRGREVEKKVGRFYVVLGALSVLDVLRRRAQPMAK